MSVKNRHLYKLIERIRRDEVDFDNEQEAQAFFAKHGLRHEEDRHTLAYLEGILADWESGIRPSDDDVDVVMEALRYAVLPRTGGKLRKSQQAKDAMARIDAEGRALQKQNRKNYPTAAAAWRATIDDMKRRHPAELANKSDTALKDRWSRRH